MLAVVRCVSSRGERSRGGGRDVEAARERIRSKGKTTRGKPSKCEMGPQICCLCHVELDYSKIST